MRTNVPRDRSDAERMQVVERSVALAYGMCSFDPEVGVYCGGSCGVNNYAKRL